VCHHVRLVFLNGLDREDRNREPQVDCLVSAPDSDTRLDFPLKSCPMIQDMLRLHPQIDWSSLVEPFPSEVSTSPRVCRRARTPAGTGNVFVSAPVSSQGRKSIHGNAQE
jgi:hypothetical protein